MEDAAEILGGTVTGQAKGKSITLPTVQAMFRTLCRQALKGDNQALRRVIELMLTLEPVARDKAKQAEEKDKAMREVARKFDRLAGFDPDEMIGPEEPDPKRKEREKRLDAMVREERRAPDARSPTFPRPAANAPITTGLWRATGALLWACGRGKPSPICRQARPRPGSPRCKACGSPRGQTRR